MKKKLIAIASCAVLGASFLLAGCGNSNNNATAGAETAASEAAVESAAETTAEASGVYADYDGKTFKATDPWGGEATITAHVDGTSISLDYVDNLSEEVTFESSIMLLDELTEIPFEMGTDQEEWSADYSGKCELKDGKIIITLEDGALTTKSSEGDSNSHQVGPLGDDERVITFEAE